MIDLEILKKAIILTQSGKIKEAEEIYLGLINQEPENHLLLSTVGLFYVNIKNFEQASIYLKKACEIQESFGTVSAYGFAEYEQGNYEKAAAILEYSLKFGENADIYNCLILSLFQIQNIQKAVEYTGRMYEKYPENPNSTTNMVKALTRTGKLIEAEKLCVEYLREHQDAAALWFHLGYLKELIHGDDKQACECYKIAHKMGHDNALYNIAVSYTKQSDFENAEKYYKLMLEKYPEDIDTISSLGMCYLTQRKFKEGYEYFFKRDKGFLNKLTTNPYKIGDNLEKEVVVICDQGYGDHIQFSRYLHALNERVEKIYLVTLPALTSLFEKNYPFVKIISREEINPQIQAVRICDLPYVLGINFENIPFAEGYLKSEASEIDNEKLKIGLCWEAGSAGLRTMINRTINIKLLEPILDLENTQIYSFQVKDSLNGNERYSQMINLAKDFKSFEDTAKALLAMDVVVTVDTSVAHLAGALGVKTFLMLPYASDWRWFTDTKTTPWYNSVEIFKQNDPISWENVICEITERLKAS